MAICNELKTSVNFLSNKYENFLLQNQQRDEEIQNREKTAISTACMDIATFKNDLARLQKNEL